MLVAKMQALRGVVRRATGWALFLAPPLFLLWIWVRYMRQSELGLLPGVLVSCQTFSGPFAWVLLEVDPWPPVGWIFAGSALGFVAGYSWIIWRTDFGRRCVLLHPLVSFAWCLVGFLRTAPYVT